MGIIFSLPKGDLTDTFKDPVVELGQLFCDQRTGHWWMFGRAHQDLEYGDWVCPVYQYHQFTLGESVAAGTRELPGGSAADFIDTTFEDVPPESQMNERLFLSVYEGTGLGQRGVVRRIHDKKLTVQWLDTKDGTLKTALNTTSKVQFSAPWRHQKAVASYPTIGPVQVEGGVKKNVYYWVKILGPGVGKVLVPAADLGAGVPLAISGSSGVAEAQVASDVRGPVGYLEHPAVVSAQGTHVLPVQINCTYWRSKISEAHKTQYTQSHQDPPLPT